MVPNRNKGDRNSFITWSTDGFAAGNEIDENHDDGDDKKNMDKAANRVTCHQTKEPKDNQNDCNGV